MKLWDLYYWNKHEYCWKWKGMAEGETAYDAIRMAKAHLPEAVKRGDMMRVVEYCGETKPTLASMFQKAMQNDNTRTISC